MPSFKRRNKLPKPSLQLRLTMVFVGTTTLSLVLQYLLFANLLGKLAIELPHDELVLMEAQGWLMHKTALYSALVFLPLTFLVGVLSTFRVAGPVYRLEAFLRSIRAGERPESCRLRDGDQLQELCDLVNEVTEPLRATPPSPNPPTGGALDLDSAPSLIASSRPLTRGEPVN